MQASGSASLSQLTSCKVMPPMRRAKIRFMGLNNILACSVVYVWAVQLQQHASMLA